MQLIVMTALTLACCFFANSFLNCAENKLYKKSLTMKVLAGLPKHDGPMVIYGEGTNMTNDRLRSLGIKFKKTPNDIRAR